MKFIIKYVYISIVLIVIFSVFSIISKADSNINSYDTKVKNDSATKYIKLDNIEIIVMNDKVYYLENNLEELIEGQYITHLICNNTIYLVINNGINYIYKIDSLNKIDYYQEIFFDKVNDIEEYDDNIIVIGSNLVNSVICKYDYDLNEIDYMIYEGEGFQEFTHILVDNFNIYVGGIKSAHTTNDYYENVGNKGEIKSFIFMLDNEFKILESCYFNENYFNEKIRSILFYDDLISLILESDELYLFEITKDLKNASKITLSTKGLYEIYTGKKECNTHMFILQDSVLTKICYYDKNNKLTVLYSFEGEFINYFVDKGTLYIYYNFDNKLYLKEINEYHEIYIKPLVCDYYNYDEKRQTHFKMNSFFEDLRFEQYLITPYFSRNLSGEYISKYKAIRQNNDEIYLETPLIVKPYLNVVDGGIYNKGMRIYYFGVGKLNGKNIVNGTALNDCGENILEITDANGNVVKYTFYVVENYYKSSSDFNVEADIIINRNDILLIPLNTNKEIDHVIINNIEYRNIRLVNDIRYVEILPDTINEIQNYNIERIVFKDGTIENLNENFIVRVNKQEVTYNLYETYDDGLFNLNINTNDPSKNIKDIYIEVLINDKLIDNISTYINNLKGSFQGLEDHVRINIFSKTYTSIDQLLFSYEGVFNSEINMDYEISFDIENEIIKNINFKLDLGNPSMKHNKILLLNEDKSNILNKYQVEKSNIVLYISIALSVVIISVFVVLLKRNKKKKQVIEM